MLLSGYQKSDMCEAAASPAPNTLKCVGLAPSRVRAFRELCQPETSQTTEAKTCPDVRPRVKSRLLLLSKKDSCSPVVRFTVFRRPFTQTSFSDDGKGLLANAKSEGKMSKVLAKQTAVCEPRARARLLPIVPIFAKLVIETGMERFLLSSAKYGVPQIRDSIPQTMGSEGTWRNTCARSWRAPKRLRVRAAVINHSRCFFFMAFGRRHSDSLRLTRTFHHGFFSAIQDFPRQPRRRWTGEDDDEQ